MIYDFYLRKLLDLIFLNNFIVCRHKYNINSFNENNMPDVCYNTIEGVSINLISKDKVYGKYSYYDLNELEEYQLDLSDDMYVSTIGEKEVCPVRTIFTGTSGVKSLDKNIIT